MGTFISTLATPIRSIKERLSTSKSKTKSQSQNSVSNDQTSSTSNPRGQTQPLSSHTPQPRSLGDVQQGLQNEHLPVSLPPASHQAIVGTPGNTERLQNQGAEGSTTVLKAVGLEAPIPVPTATLDANTSTSTPKTTKSLNKKDRMATDEEYMAFLDKANEDLSVGKSKTTEKKDELKATDKDINIPSTLVKATEDAWYISDADEPFVPVSLWVDSNTLPDEPTFAKLIDHPSPSKAEITIQDIGEWDVNGQYKEVVEAVREASKGSDVRVYRVQLKGARVEYWVISVLKGDGKGGKARLVGAKALGVES